MYNIFQYPYGAKNAQTYKFVKFSGRANRTEFWSLVLTNGLIWGAFVGSLFYVPAEFAALDFFYVLFLTLSLFLSFISAGVRRFHDRGLSGGWLLLLTLLIPIGWIAALIIFLRPSQPGKNRYDEAEIDSETAIRPFWTFKHLWILFAIAILILATQLQITPTRITAKTHLITGPLQSNGLLNYKAKYERLLLENFNLEQNNVEQNGFRDLLRAFGAPVCQLKQTDLQWRKLCQKVYLDPEEPPEYAPIPDYYNYLTENKIDPKTLNYDRAEYNRRYCVETDDTSKESDETSDDLSSIYYFYMDTLQFKPWNTAEHPVAAAWLESMAPQLIVVSQALRKPFYVPYSSVFSQDDDLLIFQNNFGFVYDRTLARAFAMRAMSAIGSGKFAAAIDDIESIYLLAGHLKQVNML